MPAPAAQPTIVVSPVDTDEVVPVMRRDVGNTPGVKTGVGPLEQTPKLKTPLQNVTDAD